MGTETLNYFSLRLAVLPCTVWLRNNPVRLANTVPGVVL